MKKPADAARAPEGATYTITGHRRRQHLGNDRTRGIDQAARSTQFDQHRIGIGLACLFDGAADVFVADRLDGVVQADLDDAAGGRQYLL